MAEEMSLLTRKRKFPRVQDMGLRVYDIEKKIFRDNSRFVTEIVDRTNVHFTRPPQLGKTTLLSLAELLLSNTKKAPAGLESYPDDTVKNSWYVIRIDFGGVGYVGPQVEWEEQARQVDSKVHRVICRSILDFLRAHVELRDIFNSSLRNKTMNQLDAGELISILAEAIEEGHGNRSLKDNTKPTLLLLVDEYDKPIRDVLFDFIGSKIPDIRKRMKAAFAQYVQFFNNIKSSNSTEMQVKAWVTGITPVGLTLISSFRYYDYTFRKEMADAVGLLDSDVSNMLDEAIHGASFDEGEKTRVLGILKMHFNNLGFPYGSPLYHTGLMNRFMDRLQACEDPHVWLDNIATLKAEELPSCAFDVIKRAKTSQLRALVSQLADKRTLTGYSINENISVTALLEQGALETNQYLTLLVHLGVVSVTYNNKEAEFKSTSEFYRKKHLAALNFALASSIADLLMLQTKEAMYLSGKRILLEFLHALSEKRMAALIAWAASGVNNRILELQLQGNIVETLHEEFEAIAQDVATTQEDKLESGRSDVTFTTEKCKVVLELKKKDSSSGPTANEWKNYHSQLRNCVEEHRRNANSTSQWVAGFVLVMYNGGKSYDVQKLANDLTT